MKRITLKIMLIMIVLTFVQCPAFFSLNKKESKLYTAEETMILEKTTKALDYDFAYDPEVDLDYIFEFSRTKKDAAKSEKEFPKVIENIKPGSFISFYEKIYSLKLLTMMKLEDYKNDENWKYTTYIEKHLLPSLNSYLAIIEKYVVIKDKEYGKELPVKKKAVHRRLLLQLHKEKADKEFEEGYYN
jgi:hypothetical protein